MNQGDFAVSFREFFFQLSMSPQNHEKYIIKGFGHLKTRLFTTKTSKNVGLGGAHGFPSTFKHVGFMFFQSHHFKPE